MRAIYNGLTETDDGTLNESFFLDLLGRRFSERKAREQMDTAIEWGRYGELYSFTAKTGELKLERPAGEDDRDGTASP
ncbi:MAG: AAA-associated domain-containing protein [Acidimicrobiales bacterium]